MTSTPPSSPPSPTPGPTPGSPQGSTQGPTDAELLAAHVAGDSHAFAELVRRHRDRLWAVALRTLGDREEAADAVQEALLSAFRRADTFRGDAAVTTWLHRIVVNACLDRARRRAVRPTTPLGDLDPAQRGDDVASAEQRLDVARALARIPEAQRLALVLVDMEGLPVSEAAAVLGVPEGTVKSRCARGRAALAPLLRPRADAPTGPDGPGRNQAATPGVRAEESPTSAAAAVADDARGGGPVDRA